MKYLRLLLFPFSLIYGLVVLMRNWCYDAGLLESRSFNLPVISVGNLEIGGAGKSPMTEYLIRLLKDDYKLSTLSRGYGRKTKGFLIANDQADATLIGDEPAQFKHKFPKITVAVCEKRVTGIEHLKADHNLVILDDAYQHRAVKPGLSILLFDYHQITHPQFLLPAGNLREPLSGRWRADVMVISKCPVDIDEQAQQSIAEKLSPLPYQSLFFSTIKYLPSQNMAGHISKVIIDADTTIFLLTGIANPNPLVLHIKKTTSHVIHHNYPDHHSFSLKNITKLANDFNACATQKKLIITTEKDAQRLANDELRPLIDKLPILVQPIGISFLQDQQAFDQIILNYVREYTAHR
ncbi:tetraacyldisaccharide 4'-kinase [Mucilaginibacter auburnensis]|uniref:Tetraacyldisaccharide 4'-kinase n=1 Tax=Mucilaginibacter auburnensis TaxID=1457233 RepID=A0A2H9VUT1_9SPHI|nr:tetraacyldisaccharide 4'-kinase [Mucilaginibacter auburnensis]PJJ84576.1 tetraacyldisaccharide 4'-kinase [Mucilaginibacter auburnensis]